MSQDQKEEIEQANELKSPKSDFTNWYNQVISAAGILDRRYNVKGCFVWLPYGYKAMMNIKAFWDKLFQEYGIKEMYFPLLVPREYASMNKGWFDGFKEEAFWAIGFGEKNPEYMLRPTGEPAIYPMFKLWTRTKSDLPIRMYETVSSFRYETKDTRALIRDREITVWHEIHTAHATREEADEEAKLHIKLYDKIWEHLAMVPIRVKKPDWDVFPGAVGAVEYYSIMPNGKVMENGSVNMLGQAFSKAFDITFKDERGVDQYVWQVCTGNGARWLAAVISIHGDDKGLVMPPSIAPIKFVIIPIFNRENQSVVISRARELHKQLSRDFGCVLDDKDEAVGRKFYEWEIKGVSIRVELGGREIESGTCVLVRRDSGEKITVKLSDAKSEISKLLKQIQKDMYSRAKKEFEGKISLATSIDEVKKLFSLNKVAKVNWCGGKSCWEELKKTGEGVEIFGNDLQGARGKCVVCKKDCNEVGYVGNPY